MVDLDSFLNSELLIITKYLVDNPGLHQEKAYQLHQIIDFPGNFVIESGELFAIMSSAFYLNRSKRESFLDMFPETTSYMKSLGPNRQQYAMLLFDFLRKIDALVSGIIQRKIASMEDYHAVMDLYENHDEFRYRKGIFLACPDWMKAKIILFDPDPRIRRLRYL